jgi:hypothetical protein
MALQLDHERAIVLIRQSAFEASGVTRSFLDVRYNLTPEEFRVEEGLVAVGPLASSDDLSRLIEDLEGEGLVYFDDFFDLSGNWPDWLVLYVRARRAK